MDISLNITNDSSVKQAVKPVKGDFKTKRKQHQSNGFSFNFVKNDKIKAVVARKRPVKVIATQKSGAKDSNKQFNFPNKINENDKKHNITKNVQADKKTASSVEDVLLNLASVKRPEDNAELSLNVTIDTNVDPSKLNIALAKKKKLSRTERKERVMQKRIELAQQKFQKPSGNEKSNKPKIEKSTKRMQSLFSNNPEVPVIGQRFVKPLNEIVFTGLPMNSIGLHPHLVKTLADLMGITELTNVQQRTVPVILEGRDALVRSQTGSGKTLAYALPMVQQLQSIQPKLTRTDGIRALCIVPTRELAMQTYEVFVKLLKPFTSIVSTYITGGEKRKSEKARLRKGVNILIGTPGRICDHLLHTEAFKLDRVKLLALDEADRLYELGYENDVKIIVDALNNKPSEVKNPFAVKAKVEDSAPVAKLPTNNSQVQSVLLSATLSSAVQQLAGLALKNPLFIDTCDLKNIELPKKIPVAGDAANITFDDAIEEAVANENIVIPETVTQSYILVPPKLRLVTLSGLIAAEVEKAKETIKILVFLATENLVDYHYDLMTETLTKKVLDSDDEADDSDEDDRKDPARAVLENSDSELEDEEEFLAKTAERNNSSSSSALLGDVRFFKLHGSLTQQERSAIFKAFREAKSGVLLTTDVTARGIDVPMVDLVVQYSPPHKIADYVHRVGRTARAGRSGRAILFLAPNETEFIRTLEDKRIRISQSDYKEYLKGIKQNDLVSTGTVEEKASELQRKFEALVKDDKEIYQKACKEKVIDDNVYMLIGDTALYRRHTFVSWLRFISSFPKDLRTIFNVKNAHMGHYAKSLGLCEPPKSFTKQFSEPKAPLPVNRLTYTDRNRNKKPAQNESVKKNGMKRPAMNLNKFVSKSISLSTSEFGSGLPPAKKKKK